METIATKNSLMSNSCKLIDALELMQLMLDYRIFFTHEKTTTKIKSFENEKYERNFPKAKRSTTTKI